MENKKTVEEIRNEITSLEEQEFQIKYGLSSNQYFELKRKLGSDLDDDRKYKEQMDMLLNPYSFKEPKSRSIFDDIDIRDLKDNVKHLKNICKWHSVVILLLSISLILAIIGAVN